MKPWFVLSPLLTDLYELTMAQVYVGREMFEEAAFSLFVRELPGKRPFLVAAGLEPLLLALEHLRFTEDDLAYLESLKLFKPSFLDYLKGFHFTGEVWALREGTVFFAQEPVVEVTAPLPEAQLVETLVINLVNIETAVATKAALCVLAAQGRPCVDFGARRTQGLEASLHAARASYIAGFSATSNVLAGRLFGIPVSGTMAHSFVESFATEEEAFSAFAQEFPDNAVFLIDTYDTLEGARAAVRAAQVLEEKEIRPRGVRLDSGRIEELAREVRGILDGGGFPEVKIFASGGLDEEKIRRVVASGAPVDAFGVGTKMGVSADAPYLDLAYKLTEYAGRPALKLSEGKVTFPGKKQVFREKEGSKLAKDILALREEDLPGEPLLSPVMRGGRALSPPEPLAVLRERVKRELASLPEELLQGKRSFRAGFSEGLLALYQEACGRVERRLPNGPAR
ncbi:nicotinate phosphoribosyltransferase [Thermodesulfitimonas sp.]